MSIINSLQCHRKITEFQNFLPNSLPLQQLTGTFINIHISLYHLHQPLQQVNAPLSYLISLTFQPNVNPLTQTQTIQKTGVQSVVILCQDTVEGDWIATGCMEGMRRKNIREKEIRDGGKYGRGIHRLQLVQAYGQNLFCNDRLLYNLYSVLLYNFIYSSSPSQRFKSNLFQQITVHEIMSKIIKKQANKKQCKQTILERLNREIQKTHRKPYQQTNAKPHCTPNDKTNSQYEKLFQEFGDMVKVKYSPVPSVGKKKTVKRCMYIELLELKKNIKSREKSKNKENKTKRKKCYTQTSEKNEGNLRDKKSRKISKENTYRKNKIGERSKTKEETFTLKRHISSTNFPMTMKRSESLKIMPFTQHKHSVEKPKKQTKLKKILSPYQSQQSLKTKNIY